MRQYNHLWQQLKRQKRLALAIEKRWQPRVIKAIIGEKNKDNSQRKELGLRPFSERLKITRQPNSVVFELQPFFTTHLTTEELT